MENHIYYCRIYFRLLMDNSRIMLPLFISGNSEKGVDEAIYSIITAIHKSPHFKNDGSEAKIWVGNIPPLSSELKPMVEKDFKDKDLAWLYIGMDGNTTNINRLPLDDKKYVGTIHSSFITETKDLGYFKVCVLWEDRKNEEYILPKLDIISM